LGPNGIDWIELWQDFKLCPDDEKKDSKLDESHGEIEEDAANLLKQQENS